jgi:hypothetical protein
MKTALYKDIDYNYEEEEQIANLQGRLSIKRY